MDTTSDSAPSRSPVVEVTAGGDETVTLAVVRAVAAVTGRAPNALPPLADAVDPDGLEHTVASLGDGGRVVFAYFGHVVAVHASGTVEVYEAEDPLPGVSR